MKPSIPGVLQALCVALVLPAPLYGQATARPAGTAETSPSPLDEYRVGTGDVLQLFVWKEPELTRDLTVRVDGKMTLPLLGDVAAAGKTPSELSAEIAQLLSRFVSAPQVTVGVGLANSARFYVIGQVGHSGEFPLTTRMTVLQGLALAGGFQQYAKTDSILIVRQDRAPLLPKGRPSETILTFNYKKLESGKEQGENVLLRPGDTIVVPGG